VLEQERAQVLGMAPGLAQELVLVRVLELGPHRQTPHSTMPPP